MADLIEQILTIACSAWRRRAYALLVAWLVCLTGWAIVALLPDIYRSSAVVYVDTANILQPLLKGLAVEKNIEAEVELMQRTLVSRPNLEKVVRVTDLDLAARTPTDLQRMIENLSRTMQVRRQGPNLFTINYEDKDPRLARDVVQAVLTIFVENNLGQSRQDMDTARRFIEEQVQIYETQLEEAERRLARFKQANLGLLSVPGGGGYQRQYDAALNGLAQAESALRDARLRRQTLLRELQAIPQFFPSASEFAGGPPSDTDIQILELQKTLDDLLSRYTEKHPDVVVTRRKLEGLLELQQQELDAAAERASVLANESDGSTEFGASNPVYEQIKIQLVQEEANIAFLTDRVAEARANLEKIKSVATKVPQVEAELKKLNRDYDVLKAKYNDLLARRETEKISRARELQADDVQFRVLEPPTVPAIPSGPERLLFLAMVLITGIGSGIGLTVVLAYSSDTFSNATQLKAAFALPTLGGVSTSDIARYSTWARVGSATFWTVLFALLAVFAGLVFVEMRIGLSEVMSGDEISKFSAGWLRRLPIF
ncbi:MAG: XrtA system polysaccharide chain length determinant [Kiloniellaceae bacterium]